MRQVQLLHETTKELNQLVQQLPIQADRETTIEKISSLLEKRGILMNELKGPYSDEEKKLGQEIVKMNAFIDSQIERLKQHIQRDIGNLQKKKQSQKKYINPYYSSGTFDGAFYDKRK